MIWCVLRGWLGCLCLPPPSGAAEEGNMNASQAITQLILAAPVENKQMKGQIALEGKKSKVSSSRVKGAADGALAVALDTIWMKRWRS